VVRTVDGVVEVLDEDEFLTHQATLGYPSDLIVDAQTAADRAVDMLRRGDEPFGRAPSHWIEVARNG